MRVEAALVKEQGVTFAVVAVKSHVMHATDRDQIAASYAVFWQGVPVVLMAQDSRGVARFYGRRDLVSFLSNVAVGRLPWRAWSLN